jgi:hypothetical protein
MTSKRKDEAIDRKKAAFDWKTYYSEVNVMTAPHVAVLAGNKREFDQFVHEKRMLGSGENYIYVDSTRVLMGVEFDSMQVTGTFMARANCHEIYDLARAKVGRKDMALSRKALKAITEHNKRLYGFGENDDPYKGLTEGVIPTNMNDPDFGKKDMKWSNPPAPDKFRGLGQAREERLLKQIEATFQGEEKPLQSLAASYLEMVTTTEDSECLKQSMDILFPDTESTE